MYVFEQKEKPCCFSCHYGVGWWSLYVCDSNLFLKILTESFQSIGYLAKISELVDTVEFLQNPSSGDNWWPKSLKMGHQRKDLIPD